MINKVNSFLSAQLGLDFLRFLRAFLALPNYFLDLWRFQRGNIQKIVLRPCLHDRGEEAGTTRGEYFWQDLYIARKIYREQPIRHVDVGSRFDGFVAHVASYRELEVIDIRPIQAVVPGVQFRQMDMMSDKLSMESYCDSLSCLHSLEHFGLGRYGDTLDQDGHIKGLRNLVKLLQPMGRFYLSVPVGIERIEFNANRVFCPEKMLALAEKMGLFLEGLGWIAGDNPVIESRDPLADIQHLKKMQYALGIFVFIKQTKN